ncbi:proton-coupled folate transporter-like isoform X1 [Asterias rubens]|uniref:proton-coupled folate transporter-like isoform X1 n=2 Tax=Asterias rubens TaxID=7604 RepID=UPI001455B801|nr:proton-coupled folate transporter-like isoform X1 [Asterias rubens]
MSEINEVGEYVEVTSVLLKPSLTNRQRAQARWITVEPVISFSIIGIIVLSLIRPLYIKDRIRESHNVTDIANVTECGAPNSTADPLDAQIQSEVSLWLLYLSGASGIPSIITTPIYGTISDRVGRKFCMAVPIVGLVLQEVVYCLTIYFSLPLEVFLAGEVLQGVTGGFALMFSGCMSYLTDCTTVKQRTFRIVIAEMLTYFLAGVGQLGEGYIISYYGYLLPLYIAFGVNIILILYITIPRVLIETMEKGSQAGRMGFFDIGRSIKKLIAFNENGRRWQLLLLNFSIFTNLVAVFGLASLLVLYGTAQPFCWSPATAGFASALSLLSMSFGMLVGTKLFSLCLGDYWLIQIGCLSMFLALIGVAVAQSSLVIFIGIGAGLFRGIPIPVARSVLSKITNPDETGAMFAIVACLESIATLISVQVASGLYAATVSFLPPLTFYAYAGFCCVPAGITIALQIFWPRRNEYTPLEPIDMLVN